MRLTILGGSSPFTTNMFTEGRAARFLGGFRHITLYGRDRRSLELVRGRIIPEVGRATLAVTTDLAEALCGADVVLVQLRYGGLALRRLIEETCYSHGLFADESLGVGGLATALCVQGAWRGLGNRLHHDCPAALTVNMINPLSLSSQLLQDSGARTIGLCEGPLTTARQLAAHLCGPEETFDWDCAGLNHRAFVYDIRLGGRPLPFAALADLPLPRACGVADPQSGALISKEMAQARSPADWTYGRAETVARMRAGALKGLAAPTEGGAAPEAAAEAAAGARRPTPWYDDAVLPLLAAWSGWSDPFDTTINHPVEGLFLESRFCIGKTSLTPRHRASARATQPRAIAETVAALVQHERAVLACLELAWQQRDPASGGPPSDAVFVALTDAMASALAADPLIPEAQKPVALVALREIIARYRDMEQRPAQGATTACGIPG